MPTFNDGELGGSIRSKLNNVINRTERVMIVASTSDLASLVYTADTQWTVTAGMKVFCVMEGFSYDVLASGASTFDIQPGAVKLNLLPGADGLYNFKGMLPAANGTTDDSALLRKLIDKGAAPTGAIRFGPSIYFPFGTYYMGSTIELKETCKLLSDGGYGSANGATLLFAANTNGIIVNRSNTLGGTEEIPPTTGADASTIQGLRIKGSGGTDKTKAGVTIRARCALRSCVIETFSGNGITIEASAGVGGTGEGNANVFYIENVTCTQNGGNGYYCNGADSNAGTIINLDCASNGRHGIWDSSFLGNVYIGCHAATNGAPFSGGNSSTQSNSISYGGQYYIAHWNATEAELVATTPGTNNNIWYSVGLSGGPNPGNPLWQAGQPVGTYFPAFAYRSDDINAQNMFLGCYNELDGYCVFQGSARIDSGSMANILVGTHLYAGLNGYPTTKAMNFGQAGFGLSITDGGGVFTIDSPTTSLPWRLQQDGVNLVLRNGNLGNRNAFYILGDGSTTPYKFGVLDWVINGVREGVRSAAPTTEFWPTGSYVRNSNVASGQPRGWRCTVGGTPGTWVADSNWP